MSEPLRVVQGGKQVDPVLAEIQRACRENARESRRDVEYWKARGAEIDAEKARVRAREAYRPVPVKKRRSAGDAEI